MGAELGQSQRLVENTWPGFIKASDDDSFSHLMLYAFSLVNKWNSVWSFGASRTYKVVKLTVSHH